MSTASLLLAAAVREVNEAYADLPAEVADAIHVTRSGVDAEVAKAIQAGDQERERAVVRAWKNHWLHTFEWATR